MEPIRIAISTCPNDTFAFHGLLSGRVHCDLPYEIELLDIRELNDGLFAGRFDVAKASFHAALRLAADTLVLPSGSALGFGVGPLLLAAREHSRPGDGQSLTLCPGPHTTATLLFKLFFGNTPRVEHMVFSEIMPRLQSQTADFGVCIHEGRFTWEQKGLFLVEDLGTCWERETGTPLPLGGILARKSLGHQKTAVIQQAILDSLQYGMAHRDETLESMRKYAQEFDDDVLFGHVDLYVNRWTMDLGREGRKAISALSDRARKADLIPPDSPGLQIWSAG